MIYLDHAATTPLSSAVLAAMQPFFTEYFGNASSTHQIGQKARHAIDHARAAIAAELFCDAREIIFTSGGTESNNLALRGVMTQEKSGHLIFSTTEHPAVRETAMDLKKMGYEITALPVDETGRVALADVEAAIRPDTRLISVMLVNNETGAVQPVREIGKMLEKRRARGAHAPLLHTDAVQAAAVLSLDVRHLKCDLLSLSAHKIGGQKGVGLLWSRADLKAQITGGGQEHRLRSGTENVSGIVGFAAALREASATREETVTHLKKIKMQCWEQMKKEISNAAANGDLEKDAPHILNFSVRGLDARTLAMRLDLAGIAVSTGSACSSGTTQASHVVSAMLGADRARAALRLSFSHETTADEIKAFVTEFKKIITDLA